MTRPKSRPALGALFDWDGVILDSAELHEKSWIALADEAGKPIAPGSFLRGFGMRNEQIIPEIQGWTHDAAEIKQLSLRKESLYRDIVRDSGITPLPGVVEFIARLKALGVPRAVASSTHRLNIDTILEVLDLTGAFDAIVSAEDVSRGKPHPEVFLTAAAKIGVAPQSAVVFEDAHVGIAAARSAGMRVVAVTTAHRRDQLTDADLVVDRLDELTVEQLLNLSVNGVR